METSDHFKMTCLEQCFSQRHSNATRSLACTAWGVDMNGLEYLLGAMRPHRNKRRFTRMTDAERVELVREGAARDKMLDLAMTPAMMAEIEAKARKLLNAPTAKWEPNQCPHLTLRHLEDNI